MVYESISKTTYFVNQKGDNINYTLPKGFYTLHNVEGLGKVLERLKTNETFLEGTPQMNLFLERLKDNK